MLINIIQLFNPLILELIFFFINKYKYIYIYTSNILFFLKRTSNILNACILNI